MDKQNGQFSTIGRKKSIGVVSVILLAGLFIFFGCSQPTDSSAPPPNYSLDDLETSLPSISWYDEEQLNGIIAGVAYVYVLNNGYAGYNGKVIKFSPTSPPNWGDGKKPIVYTKQDTGGPYKISISMSVLVEGPDKSVPYTGKGNISFTRNNGGFDDFAQPQVVPTDGKWHDITFSEKFIDLVKDNSWSIFLDGYNADAQGGSGQGLRDLVLYVRNFKVTLEKTYYYVALTFDDGPTDKSAALLDELNTLYPELGGIKATFFLVGMRVQASDPDIIPATDPGKMADIVKRMHTDGHDIGNHSNTHNYLGGVDLNIPAGTAGNPGARPFDNYLNVSDIPYLPGVSFRPPYDINFPYEPGKYPSPPPTTDPSYIPYTLSTGQISNEILNAQAAIQMIFYPGYPDPSKSRPLMAKYFRTPFTIDQVNATNLKAVTKSLGLPVIYGYGTDDYDKSDPTTVANNLYDAFHKKQWAIVIAHDPQWSTNIVPGLDHLINTTLIGNNEYNDYRFITLSEMENLQGIKFKAGDNAYDNLIEQIN